MFCNRPIIVTIVTRTCVEKSLRYAQYDFFAFPVHNLHVFGGIGHFAAMTSSQVTLYTSALVAANSASRRPAFMSGKRLRIIKKLEVYFDYKYPTEQNYFLFHSW